ncbi:TonB-dependent receptor plug domain-containing protein [Sphingomonas adhaesiva]|uniref:TonB-dependent receptor plug domain-containing protein n=1 Tax=Sphingomonas adhaesiva TaxID=28212 RepID=UPI002FF8C109
MRHGFTISLRTGMLLSSATAAMLAGAAPAAAQTTPPAADAPVASGSIEAAAADTGNPDAEIIVTGSRIRRAATDTTVPVAVIDPQTITDRGFVSAGEALNIQPSLNRQLAQADGSGDSSGNGINAPSLFGLGTGRTLTLVNGRRTVTTSSGLGDSQVDANIIPVGLLQRVEVVQGGAAAVYGSDAIAGVVNYILRKDFQGVEGDVQSGVTERGDRPTYSARLTAGHNFGGGRGNIAANVEWSKTAPLAYDTRPRTQLGRITVPNSANTSGSDGIPSTREIFDARFWEFNDNGVIFTTPAPVSRFLLRQQFQPDGSLAAFNLGTQYGVPFASGGDGFAYSKLVGTLRTGVERVTANVLGHYDLTDGITLSTELLYARTDATEGLQVRSNTILGDSALGTGPIAFTRTNPFLTTATVNALSALSPTFAAGGPLFLSKTFNDLTPDNDQTYRTETYRGLLALDGGFDVGGRRFDWSVSGSYARVDGQQQAWGVNLARYNNAISAARNSAGTIVCAINANASTADDDAACAPINPFGNGNVSQAARDYVSVRTGNRYRNEQVDILATLSGAVLTLPAGDVKVAGAYEHRDEKVRFTPFAADASGELGTSPVVGQRGGYNTDEVSGELLVPLVGGDFRLPFVNALELSGAYRFVNNSIAGDEQVWNIGARWEPVAGIGLRANRSRNFRAPTLTQLISPSVQNLESGNQDPCDADRISGGPNPTQRRAACLALFQANPTYGTGGPSGAAVGASAADRLAAFQNSGENFSTTLVTTGGNRSLRNEVAKTWTYGVVAQPRFIPGLTITADRIEIDLTDGLSPFTTQNFAEACYDDANPAPGVCEAFTRLSTATANSQAGSFATGRTTTFNAGVIRFRGETYDVNYVLPLGGTAGRLEFEVAATHTARLESSVTGTVFVQSDNTANSPITGTAQPDWAGRFDLRYSNGPFRFTYQAYYLSPVLALPNATIENNPNPNIASNTTHSISFQYDVGTFAFRFGVNNLTDKQPSYPTISYGDIIGRSFYAGARFRF